MTNVTGQNTKKSLWFDCWENYNTIFLIKKKQKPLLRLLYLT